MRQEPVPRDEAVCRAFARRIEPPTTLLAYGVLWLFFVTNALVIGGMLGGIAIARALDSQRLAVVLSVALAVVLGGASIALFLVWAKRRRARAAEFVKYAVFVEGKYTGEAVTRFFRVGLLHDAKRAHVLVPFPRPPERGAAVPLLVQSEVRLALAFDQNGLAHPCRIRVDS
ncbi:MAG: hypothetical protein ACM31C_33210 [Acidobacteriota bacterium]